MTRIPPFVALAGATFLACTSPGSARQASPESASAQASTPAAATPSAATPAAATPAAATPAAATPAAAAPAATPISATTPATDSVQALRQRADRSRILGDSTAPVWMVEVSDFQCPYCARFHRETFTELRNAYIKTGKVKLAYVNYPLPMHQHAWPAAEAALCAGAQGRYWEMHNALFTTQEAWAERPNAESLFDSLAVTVGVAAPAYRSCIRDHVMRGLVQQDLDRSRESGVGSTPTFFVADTAILGAYPTPVFRRVLDSAIARAARGARAP